MRKAFLTLMATLLLALAFSPNLQAEEYAPLSGKLSDVGVTLEADLQAAVDAYDAVEGSDYSWPSVQREVDGEMEARATNDLIVAAIAEKVDETRFITDNLWLMIAAALVFIMHLGFATLETGLTRAKNTTNILFKNVMIVCIGLLTYAAIGFNLMYPGTNWLVGNIIPGVVLGISAGDLSDPATYLAMMTNNYAGYTWWTDFLFQGMFAATAATIISGCVAERIKLGPFLIFCTIYVAILYPAVGSWHWGGGFLAKMGFYDFAGSTLVHSVGGWGGLAAILLLGPRKGKYGEDGSVRPVLGHNLPLATIGVFLLWLGWFGFNGGSVLNASPAAVSYTLVTTSLAAAAGGVSAAMVSWIITKKPDLTMALNGILAGLVGITASADSMGLWPTIFIGVSSGVLVYFAVIFFDKLRIDDPVGALSVHLVCGIWGTLMVGLCAKGNFGTQLIGILAYGVTCFVFALIAASIVKALFGWRVSPEEEDEGLDIGEHGMPAYHALEVR